MLKVWSNVCQIQVIDLQSPTVFSFQLTISRLFLARHPSAQASHLDALAICRAKGDCMGVAHADTCHQPFLPLHSQLGLNNNFALGRLQSSGNLWSGQYWWAHIDTNLPILLQSGLNKPCKLKASQHNTCMRRENNVSNRNLEHQGWSNTSPARVCILCVTGPELSFSATNRARHLMPFPHISGSLPSELNIRIV